MDKEPLARKMGPLRRDTLYAQIYNQLCDGLASGGFLPGESVTVRQLADHFGTSIMPVREAMNRLIAEGALTVLSSRKVIVTEINRERFLDLIDFRCLIEPVAAQRATHKITDDGIAALAETNDAMQNHIQQGNWTKALVCNRNFHMSIYQASDSTTLMQSVSWVWILMGPFLHQCLTAGSLPWSPAHHLAVLDGLARRDATAVAEAILRDIREIHTHLHNL